MITLSRLAADNDDVINGRLATRNTLINIHVAAAIVDTDVRIVDDVDVMGDRTPICIPMPPIFPLLFGLLIIAAALHNNATCEPVSNCVTRLHICDGIDGTTAAAGDDDEVSRRCCCCCCNI